MLDDTAVGELPDPFAPGSPSAHTPHGHSMDFVVRSDLPRPALDGVVLHRVVTEGPASHRRPPPPQRPPSSSPHPAADDLFVGLSVPPIDDLAIPPPPRPHTPAAPYTYARAPIAPRSQSAAAHPALEWLPPPPRAPSSEAQKLPFTAPPDASPEVMIARTIAGRYAVRQLLCRGGMGHVYRAIDTSTGRAIALKCVTPPETDPDFAQRFITAVLSSAIPKHPNIAEVLDAFVAGGLVIVASELVPGESVAELVARQGRLSSEDAVRIMLTACNALAAAHTRGVLHRDLKPGHLLIDGTGQLKLIGFGQTRAFQRTEDGPILGLTRTGSWIAAPAFMSPEQIRGRSVDARADLYALGATLYQLLAGRGPFVGESSTAILGQHLRDVPPPVRTFAPDVSAELETIILRCLEKNPDDRFSTVTELEAALASTLPSRQRPLPASIPPPEDVDFDLPIEEPSLQQRLPPAAFDTLTSALPPSSDLIAPESARPRRLGLAWLAVVVFALLAAGTLLWATQPWSEPPTEQPQD